MTLITFRSVILCWQHHKYFHWMVGRRCHKNTICTIKWYASNRMGRNLRHYSHGFIQKCQNNCSNVQNCTGKGSCLSKMMDWRFHLNDICTTKWYSNSRIYWYLHHHCPESAKTCQSVLRVFKVLTQEHGLVSPLVFKLWDGLGHLPL